MTEVGYFSGVDSIEDGKTWLKSISTFGVTKEAETKITKKIKFSANLSDPESSFI